MASWTTPVTFSSGATLTAAQMNSHVGANGNTQYLYDLFHTAWTSFTPTLGGTSASLGTGSLVCHYAQAGKLVTARYILVGGSTTNLSSDGLTLTLPVNARDPGDYRVPIGTAVIFDALVATYLGTPIIDFGTDTGNNKLRI